MWSPSDETKAFLEEIASSLLATGVIKMLSPERMDTIVMISSLKKRKEKLGFFSPEFFTPGKRRKYPGQNPIGTHAHPSS